MGTALVLANSTIKLSFGVRNHTGLTVVTVTHDIRSVATRASRVILLGDGKVRLDGPASRVFAKTAELARWGVLAPPIARLQAELIGPAIDRVQLDVDSLISAVRRCHATGPVSGRPARMASRS